MLGRYLLETVSKMMQEELLLKRGQIPKQFMMTKDVNGATVVRKPLKNDRYYLAKRWAEDTHIVNQLD